MRGLAHAQSILSACEIASVDFVCTKIFQPAKSYRMNHSGQTIGSEECFPRLPNGRDSGRHSIKNDTADEAQLLAGQAIVENDICSLRERRNIAKGQLDRRDFQVWNHTQPRKHCWSAAIESTCTERVPQR